jgi:hypothetical protein
MMAGAICGITSGVVAYIFGCHRTKKKNENEKKELLRYIKLQSNLYDVAEQRWKEEYDDLYSSYLQMKKDTEDRDYGEPALRHLIEHHDINILNNICSFHVINSFR